MTLKASLPPCSRLGAVVGKRSGRRRDLPPSHGAKTQRSRSPEKETPAHTSSDFSMEQLGVASSCGLTGEPCLNLGPLQLLVKVRTHEFLTCHVPQIVRLILCPSGPCGRHMECQKTSGRWPAATPPHQRPLGSHEPLEPSASCLVAFCVVRYSNLLISPAICITRTNVMRRQPTSTLAPSTQPRRDGGARDVLPLLLETDAPLLFWSLSDSMETSPCVRM